MAEWLGTGLQSRIYGFESRQGFVEYADAVSTVALGLAAGSIYLQKHQWTRDGHRIRLVATSRGITWDPVNNVSYFIIVITAHNRGRGPVDIVAWGLQAGKGRTIPGVLSHPLSTSIPKTLNQGQEGAWVMPRDDIVSICTANNVDRSKVRAFVRLGDGSTVVSKYLRNF